MFQKFIGDKLEQRQKQAGLMPSIAFAKCAR